MTSQGACSRSDAGLTLPTVPCTETGRRVLLVLGGHTTLRIAALSVVQCGRIAEHVSPLRIAQEDDSSCAAALTQVSCTVESSPVLGERCSKVLLGGGSGRYVPPMVQTRFNAFSLRTL